MTRDPDVAVVGGGVIGAMCAYHLSKAGLSVTVVDKGAFGAGCSAGNCGYVSPSHVLPLTTPALLREGLKSLFQRDASFAVRPRLSPALWGWMLSFARRCNRRDMLAAAEGIKSLLHSSRAAFDDLIRDERIECEWEAIGLIFVQATAAGMGHFAEVNDLLTERFDTPAARLDADDLLELEPALKPGAAAGGYLYEQDAHLRPDRLMAEMRRVLQGRGVAILENAEVRGAVREGGRVRAVKTAGGDLAAGEFVFATGAWTPMLNRELGCRVPIQPGKGYSLTMPRPAACPRYPMIFEHHHVAVTPMKSGYRIGSTMEFAGYDETLNRRRLDLLRRGAEHYLREPHCEPVEREWYGWRPMTPDSKPYIDRSPGLENVWVAAGHNMLGLSMSAGTGRLVAEMLTGAEPHIDPRPYSFDPAARNRAAA